MNSFAEFSEKHLSEDFGYEIEFGLLYEIYKGWCNSEDRQPVGKRRVREHLREIEGYFEVNDLGVQVFRNIRLVFGSLYDED
jgi:Cdc6-like AAA superfamily ATPase